jgi:hypothetical protein
MCVDIPPDLLFLFLLFSVRRQKELRDLYEKIAKEFPFVAKQGLKQGQKVSKGSAL